jgi:hypothetical protein
MGTADGPKLVGRTMKFFPEELAAIIRKPTAKVRDGGMNPAELDADEMKVLLAYLASFK